MNLKQYTVNGVDYTYSPIYKKWTFTAPNINLIQACNGKLNATKVANIVAGSVKRTKGNGLDGMARANIARLIY